MNEETGEELPTGPTCFKKWTGSDSKTAPVLALGVIEKCPNEVENERKSSLTLVPEFTERSTNRFEARRSNARANVLLRAKILPERGFKNTNHLLLWAYLNRVDNLDAADILEIETRVNKVVKADERKSLRQLQLCNTVAVQIERLLGSKALYETMRVLLESFKNELQKYNGLTTKEMDKLHRCAEILFKKEGIPNSISGIDFPANQARHEAFRRFNGGAQP